MLLLKLPQLRVHVKSAPEVSLPLPVPILGEIAQPVEELLRLLQQVAELQYYFPILLFR